ncbi:MAG: right-handed parallel beta-helix repeat-containing protein [Kiritimatiellae bacterium]|nr:right-handed parallel beta-helix repeat-containing protein [Kiritimatiellia bacterium]
MKIKIMTAMVAIVAWSDMRAGLVRDTLVLNQDDSFFQYSFPPEKMTAEGAKEYFDLVNVGKNTHFFICANARCAMFDSKVWDTCYRVDPDLPTSTNIVATNTKLLADRGVDRVQIWIDRARERGISPWITQRMNDIHDIGARDTCSTCSFWLKHPECRRVPGFDKQGCYPWEPAALDYQHKLVREHALSLAREMLERWDVDGFECDWQRFPHHLSPEIEKAGDGAKYLTEYMREMRKIIDEISRKRGKKILLGVRVCSRMAAARGLGTDAVAWANEGLVDWVTAGAFFTTNDWGLECGEFRMALAAANPNVKFLVSFDKSGVMLDPVDWNLTEATRAECAGYFERMYAEGVRDFYVFNFFQYFHTVPCMKFVQGDGIPDEDAVRAEARAYPLTFCDSVPEGMSNGAAVPVVLKDRMTFKIKIGKVGEPKETYANLAFESPVDSAVLGAVSINGTRVSMWEEIDPTSWLRRPHHVPGSRFAYRFNFPVSALKDGVNELAIGPAQDVCVRAVELFMGAKTLKRELTVAPDGLSPKAALETIRAAKAKGDASAWTVHVKKGTYVLNETLVLTSEDSGAPEAPVRWVGEKGVVFTGGGKVGPWKKTDDGSWEADIPKGSDGKPVHFEQLWMNGKRAQRARIPNEGFLRCSCATETPFNDAAGKIRYRHEATFTNKAEMAALAEMTTDEMPYAQQFVICHWSESRRVLRGVDAAKLRTSTESEWKSQGWNKWIDKTLFYFENVRAGFDSPGEWFYDAKAGKVRYLPLPGEQADTAKAMTSLGKLSRLIDFRGEPEKGRFVTDISFEGIGFAYSDPTGGATGPTESRHYQAAMQSDGCISQTGTRHVDFVQCSFRRTGNYGMRFYDGCQSNRVNRCLFEDLGAGGIWIGSSADRGIPPPGEKLTRRIIEKVGPMSTAFVSVEDCVIRNGGMFNPEGVGVVVAHASDVTIAHNEICNFNYSGVEIGWTWGYAGSVTQRVRVMFNRIHDLGGAGMSDMGGVYSNGTGFGTRVTDNVIYNVTAFDYGGWGLYTDEGSEGLLFERNLVWNTDDGGFHQHYGTGNLVRNNIFALNRRTGAVRMSQVRYGDMPGAFDFVNNIVYVNGSPLVGDLKSAGEYALRGVWAGNLWWDAAGKPVLDGKDWNGWRTGGQEVCGMYADPLFVDPVRQDFRLKPNSPAYALGFKPFDWLAAGVRPTK